MCLLPRTSADKIAIFMATAWYMFVSCSVATISKMMAHDPLTDPPGIVDLQAVRESCDGSYLNLPTEYVVEATWQMSRKGPPKCATVFLPRVRWLCPAAAVLGVLVNSWPLAACAGVVVVARGRVVADVVRVRVVVVFVSRRRVVVDGVQARVIVAVAILVLVLVAAPAVVVLCVVVRRVMLVTLSAVRCRR